MPRSVPAHRQALSEAYYANLDTWSEKRCSQEPALFAGSVEGLTAKRLATRTGMPLKVVKAILRVDASVVVTQRTPASRRKRPVYSERRFPADRRLPADRCTAEALDDNDDNFEVVDIDGI